MVSVKIIWRSLKSALIKIGHVQTVLLMGIVYYLVIGPMAILYQIFHRDDEEKDSYWIKKEPVENMKTYLSRQF